MWVGGGEGRKKLLLVMSAFSWCLFSLFLFVLFGLIWTAWSTVQIGQGSSELHDEWFRSALLPWWPPWNVKPWKTVRKGLEFQINFTCCKTCDFCWTSFVAALTKTLGNFCFSSVNSSNFCYVLGKNWPHLLNHKTEN
jgi:hypothetical protein